MPPETEAKPGDEPHEPSRELGGLGLPAGGALPTRIEGGRAGPSPTLVLVGNPADQLDRETAAGRPSSPRGPARTSAVLGVALPTSSGTSSPRSLATAPTSTTTRTSPEPQDEPASNEQAPWPP
jgi:hypothetical protein